MALPMVVYVAGVTGPLIHTNRRSRQKLPCAEPGLLSPVQPWRRGRAAGTGVDLPEEKRTFVTPGKPVHSRG